MLVITIAWIARRFAKLETSVCVLFLLLSDRRCQCFQTCLQVVTVAQDLYKLMGVAYADMAGPQVSTAEKLSLIGESVALPVLASVLACIYFDPLMPQHQSEQVLTPQADDDLDDFDAGGADRWLANFDSGGATDRLRAYGRV